MPKALFRVFSLYGIRFCNLLRFAFTFQHIPVSFASSIRLMNYKHAKITSMFTKSLLIILRILQINSDWCLNFHAILVLPARIVRTKREVMVFKSFLSQIRIIQYSIWFDGIVVEKGDKRETEVHFDNINRSLHVDMKWFHSDRCD